PGPGATRPGRRGEGDRAVPGVVTGAAVTTSGADQREGDPPGVDQRRPTWRGQEGQAPQPWPAWTRWATAIWAPLLFSCDMPWPPKARHVCRLNCSPP